MIYILVAAVNLITLIFYCADKYFAVKRKRRIRERTLLLLAFLMGSIGALLGVLQARHKIKKPKFFILVPLFLLLHIILILFLYINYPQIFVMV